MSVPSWIWFVEPVLRQLGAAEGPVRRRDLLPLVLDRMDLSDEQRLEDSGQGAGTRARGRAGWALSHANMAGYAQSPARAHWQLSEQGHALLAKHPDTLPEPVLREIERAGRRGAQTQGASDASTPSTPDESTPDERFRGAHAEIRASVGEELLSLLRAGTPTFFERVVLQLLHAMGYGTSKEALQETSAGADGGIDGVISLDRLGLEKVYIQAKRYAEDNPVSRPAIQGFLGVIAGRRATKGVFITTSRFSKEARAFAQGASDGLVLIDGRELADLMMDYGVGVSVKETFKLVGIDGDYFEGE